MSPRSETIPPCLIELAGALAELGVSRLTIEARGVDPRALTARETDLPNVLLTLLIASGGPVLIQFMVDSDAVELIADANTLRWTTASRDVDKRLESIRAVWAVSLPTNA